MSEGACADCGAAVAFFAPACPDCGASLAWTTAACASCGDRVDHAEPGSCPSCHAAVSPWDAVVRRARAAGFHVPVTVSDDVPHPVAAGFETGRGKPAGQEADYRRPLPDGTELHVRAYDDHFEAHLDRRSAQHRVAHLARDAPLETAAGATALSLLVLGARRLRARWGTPAGAGPPEHAEVADDDVDPGAGAPVRGLLPTGVVERLPSRPLRSR